MNYNMKLGNVLENLNFTHLKKIKFTNLKMTPNFKNKARCDEL